MRKAVNKRKAIAVLLFGALLAGCVTGVDVYKSRSRLEKAQAMFALRCQAAGEKIYRTVDNVEGIFIIKLRPEKINYGNQFQLDDPYGRDYAGEGYIETFVRGSYQFETNGAIPNGGPPRIGYQYVEAVDSVDGRRYRYVGKIEEPWVKNKSYLKGYVRFVLERSPAGGDVPRYGVTYDDISSHEDREYWIAGSSLRIIDMKTHEVIAERVGYMIDLAQGDTAGGRSPWLFAANHACPAFGREFKESAIKLDHAFTLQPRQAQDFVEKVLKPKM